MFVVFVMMLDTTHELEPPVNSARFIPIDEQGLPNTTAGEQVVPPDPGIVSTPIPGVDLPNVVLSDDQSSLIEEAVRSGIKITPERIVDIRRIDGRVIWLERGNDGAGLQHILREHENDFARQGIMRDQIPQLIFEALEKGQIVGYQGIGTERPIYEFLSEGEPFRIAIQVGSNGFIVGVNPRSRRNR